MKNLLTGKLNSTLYNKDILEKLEALIDLALNYEFKPGENEDKILEIFNERTADDFDEKEKNDCAEDMFLDINDNKSVGDCHEEKTIDDFSDTMKMLSDLYKSLNMDIDVEVEEVIIEHDSKNHSESSYTKMTMKGLKLKGGLNNNK